jgi:hypothetical protein
MSREDILSMFSDLYTRLPHILHSSGYRMCYYCGEPADTVDHVPPVSNLPGSPNCEKIDSSKMFLVPSCNECNMVLSDSVQADVFDRIEVLKYRLMHKYNKHLKMPDWSKEELAELGPVLRQEIERKLRLYDLVDVRIAFSGGEQKIHDYLEKKRDTAL